MATQWFYAQNGQRSGPVSSQELKDLAANGALDPTDLVWSERLTEWTPASRVKGLVFRVQIPRNPPPLPEEVRPSLVGDLATAAGLGKFLPAATLQSMSKPAIAIGTTIAIMLVVAVVFRNLAMVRAVCFGSAFLIYYDASANRIGYVPPRSFTNMSAGAWALVTLLLWVLCFPPLLHQTPNAH